MFSSVEEGHGIPRDAEAAGNPGFVVEDLASICALYNGFNCKQKTHKSLIADEGEDDLNNFLNNHSTTTARECDEGHS